MQSKVEINPEEFTPVKGFPKYLVNENAEVYNTKRKRFIKRSYHDTFYAIGVYLNRKSYPLAVIIARTFISENVTLKNIIFLDGNRDNCKLENLEIRKVTRKNLELLEDKNEMV